MDSSIFFLLFVVGIVMFVVWIAALIDVLKSEFRGENDKLLWAVVVILGGMIGAILYFIIGKNYKKW